MRYELRSVTDDANALPHHPVRVRTLLASRGIRTPEDAERFLSPNWERDTHDPFLMKDMERVVARIFHTRQSGEVILVWSDYDMDGIPGAVLLVETLTRIGCTVRHYTPHRNKEGFGLNTEGLARIRDEGVALVITIDCGIGDVEQVAYANSIGLEIIVTDHHIPGPELPKAYAILNPKQPNCEYPEKMLCGAGVAFKLACALLTRAREKSTEKNGIALGAEKWLLDMAGLATIADLVPLTGENRTLAHFGLMVLRKSRRPGLQALLSVARADQRTLTEDDVGFTIAPRINAASRMGHAKDAFELLSSEDPEEARIRAQKLEKINAERKGAVASMAREIKMRLKRLGEPKSVLVMGSPAWKPSLLGLVASNLVEEFARPVFLWGREESVVIKGSCRSDGSVSVHLLMQEARDVFIEYGGHELSGGFSVDNVRIHALESALIEAHARVPKRTSEPVFLDGDLSLSDVSYATYREVNLLAPFGVGNPKPLFRFPYVTVDEVRSFGKAGEHLELRVSDATTQGVRAIAFYASPESYRSAPKVGGTYSLIGHLELSVYRGKSQLRIRIVEVIR